MPPQGEAARSRHDAESVLQVIVARDVADLGVPDFTLDDLRADWATPGLDLEHDVRVRRRRTARSAATRSCSATTPWSIVHPEAEGQGTGTVLRRWAEARAVRARHGGAAAVRLRRQRRRPPAPARGRLRAGPALLPPARRPRRGAGADRGARCATFEPGDEAAVHRADRGRVHRDRGPHADDARGVARARGPARPGTTRRCGCWPRTSDGLAGAALGERWENATGYVAELAVAAAGARARPRARAPARPVRGVPPRRPHARRAERARPQPRRAGACTSPSACARPGRPSAGRRHLDTPDVAAIAERARDQRTARARHGVHARGALPAAALPRAGRGRRGGLGARPAGRASTRRRSPACSPTRRSRSSSTPAARTSRSCGASGRPTSPTCSTRRWRRASPASPRRPATTACCTTC